MLTRKLRKPTLATILEGLGTCVTVPKSEAHRKANSQCDCNVENGAHASCAV